MEQGEAVEGKLLPVGGAYTFKADTCFNLEASDFIKDHKDVKGKEVGYMVRRAVATA
jgi:hypothetical protein